MFAQGPLPSRTAKWFLTPKKALINCASVKPSRAVDTKKVVALSSTTIRGPACCFVGPRWFLLLVALGLSLQFARKRTKILMPLCHLPSHSATVLTTLMLGPRSVLGSVPYASYSLAYLSKHLGHDSWAIAISTC